MLTGRDKSRPGGRACRRSCGGISRRKLLACFSHLTMAVFVRSVNSDRPALDASCMQPGVYRKRQNNCQPFDAIFFIFSTVLFRRYTRDPTTTTMTAARHSNCGMCCIPGSDRIVQAMPLQGPAVADIDAALRRISFQGGQDTDRKHLRPSCAASESSPYRFSPVEARRDAGGR